MHVQLLGPLALDGTPVPGARLAALAEALILARGRVLSTTALVEAVWDDEPPADPAGAVQALVSRLRRLGLTVQAVAGGYRADLTDVTVDAFAAQDLLGRARDAAARGAHGDAARLADDGLAAFGPGLPDGVGPFDVVHRRLLELSVEADLALGRPPTHLDGLLALGDAVPTDEPLTALAMRALASLGREAEALARFEVLRAALAEAFGTVPSPVAAGVHLALLRGELAAPSSVIAFPSGATPGPPTSSTAGAVPPPRTVPAWRPAVTPLIGRGHDVDAIETALAVAPVVTLVGVGGAGKTRLAAEVARRAAEQGRPARAVELASVRTADEVLPAVLAALGAAEYALDAADPLRRRARTAAEALAAAGREVDGLLVVDNCEHLLDAVADVVAQLVAAGPDLRVLATSRAPLGVVGEAVHPVATLPDEDALQLLRSRAQAARPSLAWDDATALRLCHALDNLPLALELAAARLRAMPLEEVLAGVGHRFALLDNALRGLPDRHRGLWAMVDWSWALLDPRERALLRDLAAVPAPFTADLAAAVATDGDARSALAALVEQSLLVLDEPADGGPARYRMLETVREYGEARLAELGDAARDGVLERLARWAEPTARDARRRSLGAGQVAALAELAVDDDTYLAVLRWAVARGRDREAFAIAAGLFQLWTLRGLHTEIVPWVRRLLRVDDLPGRTAFWAALRTDEPPVHLDDAGTLTVGGAFTAAMAHDMRAAALALRLARAVLARGEGEGPDDVGHRTAALAEMVLQLHPPAGRGELATADRLVDDPDPYLRGVGHFFRASILENRGDAAAAHVDAVAAYRWFEEVGDRWGMGAAAQAVGQWTAERSGPAAAEAEHWLDLGIEHLAAIGAEEDARALTVIRETQRARRGVPEARDALEATAATASGFERCQALVGLAVLALAQGRADDAVVLAEDAARTARAEVVSLPQALIYVESVAAVVLVRAGRDVGDLLQAAASLALGLSDMPVLGIAAVAHADLAAHRGEPGRALELWALGTRLGARMAGILGTSLALEAQPVFPDGAARAAALDAARELSVNDAVARLRALLP